MIVFISLSLSRTIPGSSVRKTWIFSLSKLILNILGSDLTGGCMNPASVCLYTIIRPLVCYPNSCLMVTFNTCVGLGDGMGVCSWWFNNQGAYTCLLACSGRGNLISCMDFHGVDSKLKREVGQKDKTRLVSKKNSFSFVSCRRFCIVMKLLCNFARKVMPTFNSMLIFFQTSSFLKFHSSKPFGIGVEHVSYGNGRLWSKTQGIYVHYHANDMSRFLNV